MCCSLDEWVWVFRSPTMFKQAGYGTQGKAPVKEAKGILISYSDDLRSLQRRLS